MTGTHGANIIAREADLVIGIGTRYSDFTAASKTAFQNPNVRFININVAEFDAYKHGAIPLIGDARVTLDELAAALDGYRTSDDYQSLARRYNAGRTTLFATNYWLKANENKKPTHEPDEKKVREWESLAERVGARIYSRLLEMCDFIEIPRSTKDYRETIQDQAVISRGMSPRTGPR